MEAFGINISPFFQWLLKTTMQGSVLICLILLIKAILKNKLLIRWHYYLWLLLLVRLTLPWSPQSRISIFNLIPQSGSPQRAESLINGNISKGDTKQVTPAPVKSAVIDTEREESQAVSEQLSQPVISESYKPFSVPVKSSPIVTSGFVDILPLFWFIGAIILAGYISLRNIFLWRAIKRERQVTDQQILDLLEDCKMQMQIQTVVGIVVTDKVKSPALFGFVRPRLLLPQGLLESLDMDELHYIFLHELSHLKRRDIYVAWVICLLQILHWFNPLIWFAFRRMRADQEMAADALALTTTDTEESRRYGKTIVNLLERFSRPQYLPSLAGILENPSYIERRIQMITKFNSNSYRSSLLGIATVILIGCVSLPDNIRAKAAETSSLGAKTTPTLRLVAKECTAYAAVSSDSRLVCYPEYDGSGELVILDLISGKQHVIKASQGTAGHEGDPLSPMFSPDGRTIAYTVANEPEDQANKTREQRLCLIDTDGTNKRVLCHDVFPVAWSSDGQKILGIMVRNIGDPEFSKKILGMTIGDNENPTYIVWVSIKDGSIQKRTEFPTRRWQAISMSPDGRYLAFDQPQEGEPNATWYEGKWDIFVLDLDSGQQSAFVRNPAVEVLLGWAPNGKEILFLSDRMGTWDAWLQPVAEGGPAGQAQLVCKNIGHITPGEFARNGFYYYQVEYNTGRIYLAEINMQNGQVVSPPKALEGTGFDMDWDWSPDGQFAAYASSLSDTPGPITIHIRDIPGGSERTFQFDPQLSVVRCLRWTPDGKSLLASGISNWILGSDGNRKEGIDSRVYRIDVDSGKKSILMQSDRRYVFGAELSQDGKALFYLCSSALRTEDKELIDSHSLLIRRDLNNDQEKSLFDFADSNEGFSWAFSHSSDHVAIALNEQKDASDTSTKKILIIPSTGGQPTELVRWGEISGEIWDIAWMPDDKGILLVLQNDTAMELWYVSIDTPRPRKIMDADLGGWSELRVAPDGRHIAFTTVRRFHELWAMENIGSELSESVSP